MRIIGTCWLGRITGGLALIAITLSLSSCALLRSQPKHRFVVISVNGMLPDFYLDPAYRAATLQRLRTAGAFATGTLPVYPATSLPNHATMVTGVLPAQHGVLADMIFDRTAGTSRVPYEAKSLKTPALWDLASQNGMDVALVGWPVSEGAEAEWLVPGTLPLDGTSIESGWARSLEQMDRGLKKQLLAIQPDRKVTNTIQYDQWIADATSYLITEEQPELLFAHFRNIGEVQRLHGPHSKEAFLALRQLDAHFAKLLTLINLENTTLVIAGDHAFEVAEKEFHVNSFLREIGGFRVSGGRLLEWKTIAQVNGSQAAIYTSDPSLEGKLVQALRRRNESGGQPRLRIYDRTALKKMGAFPDAACAIDAPQGVTLGTRFSGSDVPEKIKIRGSSGAQAVRKSMLTGFLMVGPGIPAGLNLGTTRVLDIAPTLAAQMHLQLKAQGKAIDLRKKTPAIPAR
ncbi:MAG: hypothetical protein A2X94_14270 [Bdellovibrionales bacterium GWB1_55_8]|nr:MAG: hypothetical protein A2X94_14270 [Bdellovibrionales bacterium GWB1_55_8]